MKDYTSINDYANAIIEELREYYPDHEITATTVAKGNGVTYTGVTIKAPDVPIAPNIYVNNAYEQEIDVVTAAKQIKAAYEQNANPKFDDFDTNRVTDWEYVKSRVYAKLVANNPANIEGRPYHEFLDLYVIYYVQVSQSNNRNATITVTDSMFGAWEITEQELYEQAIANTKADKPCKGKSMLETLKEMSVDDIPDIPDDGRMVVYTNEQKLNGAIAMLIADFGEKPRYILPSSIHEVLSVDPEGNDLEMLRGMVELVNDTQVIPEEVLSYSVYYWDGSEVNLA